MNFTKPVSTETDDGSTETDDERLLYSRFVELCGFCWQSYCRDSLAECLRSRQAVELVSDLPTGLVVRVRLELLSY